MFTYCSRFSLIFFKKNVGHGPEHTLGLGMEAATDFVEEMADFLQEVNDNGDEISDDELN